MLLLEKFISKVLNCGPVPQHIAVIMDGNRRYGKIHTINDKRNIYVMGMKTLQLFYRMCINISIKQLTIYAFSIENFKRSKEEVSILLEDFLPKALKKIIDEYEEGVSEQYNIRFKIIGNKNLLSNDLKNLIKKVEHITKDKNQLIVNVALAYTSREEISQAIRNIIEKVRNQSIEPNAIDVACLQKHLYLPDPVDCLVRTSGEVRFSDFLLWQIDSAQLNIYDTLWPAFGLWSFVKLIVDYQKKVLVQEKKNLRLQSMKNEHGLKE